MMGVFAEFERSMIQERVRAGLRRAVSEGKQLGRPPLDSELEERVRKALSARKETGEGVRVIAKRFGLSPTTVQKISRPFAAAGAWGKNKRHSGNRGRECLSDPEMGGSWTANAGRRTFSAAYGPILRRPAFIELLVFAEASPLGYLLSAC
jgi:Resolvase, N terminal domain